jgi:hypothetical protein
MNMAELRLDAVLLCTSLSTDGPMLLPASNYSPEAV